MFTYLMEKLIFKFKGCYLQSKIASVRGCC